jgi:accessory gene regulator B
MASFSAKITDHLAENGIINSEDKELYSYGLCQGMIMIANILTTLAIGLVFGMLWPSFIFMIAYMPLRSYAGGYHARTQLLCNIFSVLLTIIVLLIIKYLPWTNWLCLIVTFISAAVIAFLAPVEDKNKPLDSTEVRVYKKRTLNILSVEAAAIIVLLLFNLLQISVSISVSLLALSVMLILGSLSNRRDNSDLINN